MSSPKKLILVGDSLFAQIAHEYFTYDSDYEVVAFAVESAYRTRDEFRGLPVFDFETLESQLSPEEHSLYAAVAYGQVNRFRARIVAEAKAKGYPLASYISSRAFVWRNVELGEHVFIFEDNTVQPFVKIGNNVILWSGNHIGHHGTIEDDVYVSSHVCVAGNVTIGRRSFLGINSSISNDITIGEDNWIAPGVTILKSTGPNEFWLPARSHLRDKSTLEVFGIDE